MIRNAPTIQVTTEEFNLLKDELPVMMRRGWGDFVGLYLRLRLLQMQVVSLGVLQRVPACIAARLYIRGATKGVSGEKDHSEHL